MDPIIEISEGAKKFLKKLISLFDAEDLHYVLIGALPLILNHIRLERHTKDMDFVILLEGKEFEDICKILKHNGLRKTNIPHRFVNEEEKIIVDIIPVSKEIISRGEIYWPTGERMDTTGIEYALENFRIYRLGTGVKVAEVPAVILLKLIAWKDSKELKHLKDILRTLEDYERKGERRFEIVEEMDDYDLAGAYILGKDIARMVNTKVKEKAINIVRKILKECSLLSESERNLLKAFIMGMEA